MRIDYRVHGFATVARGLSTEVPGARYSGGVPSYRHCSKSGCQAEAIATLTYAYRDSSVVLGPLATYQEPHSHDLCEEHAARLTVPKGWEVIALDLTATRKSAAEAGGTANGTDSDPLDDELGALINAVREQSRADGAGEQGASDQGTSEQGAGEQARERVRLAANGQPRILRLVPPIEQAQEPSEGKES